MLTIHHLNESRSQRVVWLVEELGVPYEIKYYTRDAQTRLAPPELKAIHPLGKSPVITYDGRAVHGRLQPDLKSTDYDVYQQWLHYAEGSAMLPHMLNMYVSRLKEAGAPLHPRIESEIVNHDGYVDAYLKGREFFVGSNLTGADIAMSFVGEVSRAQQKLSSYPNFNAWLDRMHARPAWARALEKTGPYALGR
jgi:glutathione S-transferase